MLEREHRLSQVVCYVSRKLSAGSAAAWTAPASSSDKKEQAIKDSSGCREGSDQNLFSKGPSANRMRNLSFYVGTCCYSLGQVLIV